MKKKKHTVKGSRHAGLDTSYPPANLRLCWWRGYGVVVWWCGGDTGAQMIM